MTKYIHHVYHRSYTDLPVRNAAVESSTVGLIPSQAHTTSRCLPTWDCSRTTRISWSAVSAMPQGHTAHPPYYTRQFTDVTYRRGVHVFFNFGPHSIRSADGSDRKVETMQAIHKLKLTPEYNRIKTRRGEDQYHVSFIFITRCSKGPQGARGELR